MTKTWIVLACLAGVCIAAGCTKNEPAPTKQDVSNFKGHPPTPEQLQAAMAKVSQSRPVASGPNAKK